MKAGAKLCFWSALLTIISAVGMVISQNLENRFSTCEPGDLGVGIILCYDCRNMLIPVWLSTWIATRSSFLSELFFVCSVGVVEGTLLIDALSSILLIGVGNCLENVFKNTMMARVMVSFFLRYVKISLVLFVLPVSWLFSKCAILLVSILYVSIDSSYL